MAFLNTLSVLLLLIACNTSLAFSPAIHNLNFEEAENDIEVSEDISEISQGTLTALGYFETHRVYILHFVNFNFQSSSHSREVSKYYSYSRSITPSLGVSEIIFPFHTFL